MTNNNPTNRLLLNLTGFVICLPLLVFPLLPQIGIISLLSTFLNRGPFDFITIMLVIGIYIPSLFLILWKGDLLGGISSFFSVWLLTILFVRFGYHASSEPVIRDIVGYEHMSSSSIDVYCNDVHLGQTPLTISETEFRQQVKPWEKPPRQRIIVPTKHREKLELYRYRSMKLSYTPYDYFECRGNERYQLRGSDDDDNFRKALEISHYWWRFEKDGYLGFAPIKSLPYPYPPRPVDEPATVHFYGGVFPSVEPHFQHLLHALRRSDHEPTEAWIAHVRKYLGTFFPKLQGMTQRDTRLTLALQAVVKAEFGMQEAMSEGEWTQVLDKIMGRVEQTRQFNVPSPESIAVDLLIQNNPKVIEKPFVELLSRHIRAKRIFGSKNAAYALEPAQFLPLEYAVLKSSPPALFDRLVYESRRGQRFLNLVANYRREEAVRLVRHHLKNHVGDGMFGNRFTIQLVRRIRNPDLEGDLRRFTVENADAYPPRGSYGPIWNFIESRLTQRLSAAEANSLSDWIAHEVPLQEGRKLEYLLQINAPRTHHNLQNLIRGSISKREQIIRSLTVRSNPSLDQFLIDAYLNLPGEDRYLTRAMLICNTSKMHSLLDKLWNAGVDERSLLLTAMREIEQGDANLVPWTEPISEITESSLRLLAIPVLSQIDTPEAGAILESWATDTDQQVKAAAQTVLGGYRERGRQAADLISGEIHPNDLLGPQTAYVWNGRDYVPESAAVEK